MLCNNYVSIDVRDCKSVLCGRAFLAAWASHVMVVHGRAVVFHYRCCMMVPTVISSEMMVVVAGAEYYKAYCCEAET